ncbi:MAG: glycosyltransferase family 2 protein [Proteobacteria bacterium]|nr:glycosyltransferase family 2 protein [Pseudomonadota bacterium]
MKLIIQIPCLDEEQTLPATLAELPRHIAGVDSIEILVIDDGSSDKTAEVARELGVHHVLRHTRNQGLGRAFRTGLDAALKLGADIIVNTDGDGQYCGDDIPRLIAPILAGEADIVVGDRQTASNTEFGFTKKCLQWLGSYVVRSLSGTDLPDAVSGFRAISRKSAIRLNILSKFSYTVEMLIQAGNKQMHVVSVPVRTNPKTRESRLFASIPQFVSRQLVSMLRMYAMYRPMRFFLYLGLVLSVAGAIPIFRFLISYFSGAGAGNIQSLILGGVLMTMGFMVFITGLLSDLISQNRQLTEIALEKIREMELDQQAVSGVVLPGPE